MRKAFWHKRCGSNACAMKRLTTIGQSDDDDWPQGDVILRFPKQQSLRAHSQVLSLCSPVFKSMLEGEFVEGKTRELQIEDTRREDFVTFYRLLLPQSLFMQKRERVEVALSNVDVYYEKWVKECAESAKHSDFQKLWEVLMIRVTSEAICEIAGSLMNQHCGKNRFLQQENFNIEMYLKFNLGPLHLLDNFVK